MMRVTRSFSWALAVLLLIACAGGIYMLVERSTAPTASVNREKRSFPASVAATADESSGIPDTPTARDTADVSLKANVIKSPITSRPGQAPPLNHLKSETALLAESPRGGGMNVRTVTSLIKGDGFAVFMDQLAVAASAAPLALDLTELYAQSANEANTTVDHALALRIVCGMSVCGLSATAPSKAVFDAWVMAFLESPSARPYGVARHDKVLDDGTVEYRIVFSNDPERIGAITPRR